jgi:hypothetical protein
MLIMTADDLRMLNSFHMSCVRKMSKVNRYTMRHQRVSSKSLLSSLGLKPFEFYYRHRVLQWSGHVVRMGWDRLPRKLLTAWVYSDAKAIQGTHKRWIDVLHESLQLVKLPKDFHAWTEVAQDRAKWRKHIADHLEAQFGTKETSPPE